MKKKVFWKPIGEDVTILGGAKSVLIPKIDFVSEVRTHRRPLIGDLLNFIKLVKSPPKYFTIRIKAGEIVHGYSYNDKDEAIQDRKSLMLDIEEFWNNKLLSEEDADFIRIWETK